MNPRVVNSESSLTSKLDFIPGYNDQNNRQNYRYLVPEHRYWNDLKRSENPWLNNVPKFFIKVFNILSSHLKLFELMFINCAVSWCIKQLNGLKTFYKPSDGTGHPVDPWIDQERYSALKSETNLDKCCFGSLWKSQFAMSIFFCDLYPTLATFLCPKQIRWSK